MYGRRAIPAAILVIINAGISVLAQNASRVVMGTIYHFTSRAGTFPKGAGNISALDSKNIWVGLSYTDDGGRSWTEHVIPRSSAFDPNQEVSSIPTWFVTARTGWLSGRDTVWRTSDGGSSWLLEIMNGHIFSMAFSPDKKTGWMGVGNQNDVRNYVTNDHGQSWSECGQPWNVQEMAPLSSVSFIDEKTGWLTVARYDSIGRPNAYGVAQTEDGGCTWHTIWRDPEPNLLSEIHFVDKSFGWLISDAGSLRKTFDGGETWQNVSLPSSTCLRSGYVADRLHGWIYGDFTHQREQKDSGVFLTFDGGGHWTSVSNTDLRFNRKAARRIPSTWGTGFLIKIAATHGKTG